MMHTVDCQDCPGERQEHAGAELTTATGTDLQHAVPQAAIRDRITPLPLAFMRPDDR